MLFSLLIKVKMPIVVGILTFMSRKKSCSVELRMKKSVITSLPFVFIPRWKGTVARLSVMLQQLSEIIG